MKRLWFNPGVDHRHIGPKTPWAKKQPEAQAAIILAANKLGVDCWELVKPVYQGEYLEAARKLVAEDIEVTGEGTPGVETRVALCSGLEPQPGPHRDLICAARAGTAFVGRLHTKPP